MFNILVAEDDKNTGKLMCAILKANGFFPILAENGKSALACMEQTHVDLILSDIMMPVMDGLELVASLRQANCDVPIVMVTAKQSLTDKKQGFIAGADDYITKPVDEEELILRIKAVLRRSRISAEHRLTVGNVVLDYDLMTVEMNGRQEVLPKKEFLLLFKLLSSTDKIFTRNQLMDEIWGMEIGSDEHTVNVHINRLRSRFETCEDFEIITVRGLGYKAVKKI